MTRFHDIVGYGNSVESPPESGVWEDEIVEYIYTGDVKRNTKRNDVGDTVLPDISVQNTISIVADAYAFDHFAKIKYVRWLGVLWTVTSVEPKSPRLILTLGSVYNGPTAQ